MAHMVQQMAFVGETPWHGLGSPIPEDKGYDFNYFKEMAGMNFKIVVEPTFRRDPKDPSKYIPNPTGHNLFVREDNKQVMGLVGGGTKPLQNHEMFDWFKPFLEAKSAILHTAGCLDEGKKVWVLAKVNADPLEIVKNDIVERYILLSNSHDGTMAVRCGFTPIRVVCMNTLRSALGDKSEASKLIRIRHTKNMKTALKDVREIMNVVNSEFVATAEQYKLLASKTINQADLRKYVKLVLMKPEKGKTLEDLENEDISTKMENTIEEIMRLAVEGRGTDIKGVRGTYWGAYNAVTEYLSYEQGRTQENRLKNLWFGPSENVNARALELALSV